MLRAFRCFGLYSREVNAQEAQGEPQATHINLCCHFQHLPADLLQTCVLKLLRPLDLVAVACTSPSLRALADADALWAALFTTHFSGLAPLLERVAPAWWGAATWKGRFAALCSGATFPAQVYNREIDNEHEDFLLSCYDAVLRLSPQSARAAVVGATGEVPLFQATYLSMGSSMPAVVEAGITLDRMRAGPQGSSPYAVYRGAAQGLQAGEEVEVQWKGRRSHPFGWWFGTVQAVRGDRVVLLFRQYPRSSVWHRVKAPIQPGREAVVNGDCSFGYVGGLRRLAPAEREEWHRHCIERSQQLPAVALAAPPAGAAAPLPAEEEWSDDDWADMDVDVHEQEGEDLGPALVVPGAAAGGAAEGGLAPGAPPAEPVAMQLGGGQQQHLLG